MATPTRARAVNRHDLDRVMYNKIVELKQKGFEGDTFQANRKWGWEKTYFTNLLRYEYDSNSNLLTYDCLAKFPIDDEGDSSAFARLFREVSVCKIHDQLTVEDFIAQTIHCNIGEFIRREDERHPVSCNEKDGCSNNRIQELADRITDRIEEAGKQAKLSSADPVLAFYQQQLATKDNQLNQALANGSAANKNAADANKNTADAIKNTEKLIDNSNEQTNGFLNALDKQTDTFAFAIERATPQKAAKSVVETPKKTRAKKRVVSAKKSTAKKPARKSYRDSIKNLPKPQLQKMCADKGLDPSGTKEQMAARLEAAEVARDLSHQLQEE